MRSHVFIVSIQYVRGVAENFKMIGGPYNIGTLFNTKNALRSDLRETKSINGILEISHCVYTSSCERGKDHTDERGKILGVRLKERNYNLNERHFGK